MTELVLGIDTSTRVCVGLARDGEAVERVSTGGSRSHAEMLTPTIEALLARHQVTVADTVNHSSVWSSVVLRYW